MADHFDSLATPMLSTSLPDNFIPLNTDDNATPHVINGRISEIKKPNFFSNSTTYDDLPSVISASAAEEVFTSGKNQILNTRLWENKLYASRVKRNEKIKKLHSEMFPELSDNQMVFVYYNYFAKNSIHRDTATAFDSWNAPEDIKEIVKSRMAQHILSDH